MVKSREGFTDACCGKAVLAVWGETDMGSGGAAFLLEGALKLLREAFLEKSRKSLALYSFTVKQAARKISKQAVFLDEGKAEQSVLMDMCGIKYQRHHGSSKYK